MCRSLQEQGTKVVIATTDVDPREQIALAHEGTYRGIPTEFFPLQWGESFKYSKPLAVWLDANVAGFDVVHIHAVFNHACIAAAGACRRHRVPYVVRPLGTLDPWSMKQKALRKSLFWRLFGKRMLAAAAAVHYTASAEKSAAEGSLGLRRGQVIPLGVETPLTGTGTATELPFAKIPKLAGGPYVLVLSRLHPKKGLDIFIDAFVSLIGKKNFTGWKLVLAGEGPDEYVQTLRQKVSAHNAADAIFFPGWLENDEKAAFLQRASLLALPSHHENFGLCVMEALAAGVPVMVSPHVNLATEIEAAGAGWIAPVTPAAIEAALAEALGSEAERAQRGKAGKTLSLEFSCERVAVRLNEMYSAVTAGAAGEVARIRSA